MDKISNMDKISTNMGKISTGKCVWAISAGLFQAAGFSRARDIRRRLLYNAAGQFESEAY